MDKKWFYVCPLLIIGVVILIIVFKINPGSLLLYGSLLACPLMHIFMMKDHGKHDESSNKIRKEVSNDRK